MLNVDSEKAGRGSRSKPIKWLQHELGGLTLSPYPIITKTEQPGKQAMHQLVQRVRTNPILAAHRRVAFCSLVKFNLKTERVLFSLRRKQALRTGVVEHTVLCLCMEPSDTQHLKPYKKPVAFSASLFVLRRCTFSSNSLIYVVREHTHLSGCLHLVRCLQPGSADWLSNFFFTNFEVTDISGWQELTQACWNHLLLSPIIKDFL